MADIPSPNFSDIFSNNDSENSNIPILLTDLFKDEKSSKPSTSKPNLRINTSLDEITSEPSISKPKRFNPNLNIDTSFTISDLLSSEKEQNNNSN